MHHKIVIANSKMAHNGKSTSIRYVFELLRTRYRSTVILPTTGYDPVQDVEAIVEIPQSDGHIVKVGIESQGDPETKTYPPRIIQSIKDFLVRECEIILVATRTKGDTIDEVGKLRNVGWQVIWFDNSTMRVDDYCNKPDASGRKLDKQDERLQDQLSRDYGLYVASLIERLVLKEGELF